MTAVPFGIGVVGAPLLCGYRAHVLSARLYDAVLCIAERAALRSWRAELLGQATGVVLEVGAGTGANLPFYPPAVERVLLLEPDPAMRERLVQRASASSTVLSGSARRLPLATGSVDTVVSTLVLCSVGDPAPAVAELRRVLRPDGQLLVLEHVGGPAGSRTRAAQHLLTPLWSRVAGGCSLERDTRRALAHGGFDTSGLRDDRLPVPVPVVSPVLRGRAQPLQTQRAAR